MKGIFLLMIVYCIVACQKDNQVAKVYENRQALLEVCSQRNIYGLYQIPGRRLVKLEFYNDITTYKQSPVLRYSFIHQDHHLRLLDTLPRADSLRMVTETADLLNFLSTFEITGFSNYLTHPLNGEPKQLVLFAKKYRYIYRPDSLCSQLDDYRALGEGWYVKKDDPYGGWFRRFWCSVFSTGNYW